MPRRAPRAGWKRLIAALIKLDAAGDSKTAGLFFKPVCDVYPAMAIAYTAAIICPCDLTTVQKRVENGEYEDEQQFVDDLNRTWLNCYCFNTPQSGNEPTIYQRRAFKMQEEMLERLKVDRMCAPTEMRPSDIAKPEKVQKWFSDMTFLPNDGKLPRRKRGRSNTPPPKSRTETVSPVKKKGRRSVSPPPKVVAAATPPPPPVVVQTPPPLPPAVQAILDNDERWWASATGSDLPTQTLLLESAARADLQTAEDTTTKIPESARRAIKEGLICYEDKLHRLQAKLEEVVE